MQTALPHTKDSYYGSPEQKAWSLSQAQKIVYIDPQCYAAFKQTNFLLECHLGPEANEMQYLQSLLNKDV